MELHDRLCRLESLNSSCCEFLEAIDFDDYLTKNLKNQLDEKNLESLRFVLYYRYKSIKQRKPIQLDFKNELISLVNNWETSNEEVLSDVIILLLINFVDPNIYIEIFKELKNVISIDDEESRIKCFKIFKIILEATELHTDVKDDNFHFWIRQVIEDAIDSEDWRLLHFILPKFSDLKFIWTKIFTLDCHLSILNALCVLSDYFTADDVNIQLWEIIWQSLTSRDYQTRKKALYMLKKISDFTNVSPCFERDNLKHYFVLVMESLEEKQKHLIIPTLPIIDTLVEENNNHRQCEICFHNRTIFCIFSRLLVHDNNFVKKWGLNRALKLDAEIFDQKFVNLIVCSLNETFLYEDLSIVKALGTWLTNRQLFQNFLLLLPGIAWGSIAIFYISQSMSIAVERIDDPLFNQDSIDAVKLLIEGNIKMGTPLLRLACQYKLFEVLTKVINVQDLMLVTELLSMFEENLLLHPKFQVKLNELTSRVHNDSAVNFVTKICLEQNIPMRIFSLLLHSFQESKGCLAKKELENFLFNLDKIDVRPFVDISLMIKVFDFINHMNLKSISLSDYIRGIYNFGLKLLHRNDFLYEHVEICLRVLKKLEIYLGNNQLSVIRSGYENKCIEVFENVRYHSKAQILLAIQLLHWCRSTRFTEDYLSSNLDGLLNIFDNEHFHHEKTLEDNKLTAEFFVALTKHIENRVNTSTIENLELDVVNWMDILSSILDRTGNEALLYSGSIIKRYCQLLRFEVNKTQKLHQLIDIFWNFNFNSKRNKIAWDVSEVLITSILSTEFLMSEKAHLDYAIRFAHRVMKEGDTLPGLKYVLLARCDFSSCFNLFSDLILNGACHGYTMRRDQRIFMQAQKEANDFYNCGSDSWSVYEMMNGHANVDAAIRMVAVVQILKGLQANANNATEFLKLVLAKLSALKAKRYYADSQLHRLKHRLMQVLLILQSVLDEGSSLELFEALSGVLITDSDQHSVRIMLEWIIALICLKYKYDTKLWQLFENVLDKRPGSASSVLGIIWLIANRLKDDELISFGKKSLTYISTCCMGQQFSMRFYGQILFVKMFELLKRHNADLKEHSIIYDSCQKSLEYGNSKKNCLKIEDDFYFNVFNACRHYTLKTIFYELPRLCNVSPEEWLNIGDFEDYIALKSLNIIQIYNTDPDLSKASVPLYMLKKDITTDSEEIEQFEAGNDLQKKIIPWKTLCPDIDCLDEFRKEVKVQDKTDMIVVASLVEKSQNLGGIARTCEIFGVNKIVLSNLKQMEDKDFQSLSVSSDRWLKIVEVKRFELSKYLLEMKSFGWTLVGAEQTANSKNLVDYKFDKKTLLILGNEKDGIAANIISILDTCIEIPQIGVTRSLNVHVTSAVCIWEYLKQQYF